MAGYGNKRAAHKPKAKNKMGKKKVAGKPAAKKSKKY